MKKSIINTLGALSLLLVTAAYGDPLPDDYPDGFQVYGILERIDINHTTIVINDRKLRISRNLTVTTPYLRFATAASLRPGMTVGANPSSGVVERIWVFPDSAAPPLNVIPLH